MVGVLKSCFVALLAITLHGLQASRTELGGVSGTVRNPDGSPNGGATVSAKTECRGMSFNLVSEVTASSDGSFHIPAFRGAECSAIRLYAEKPDDLWLKTGANVFYRGEIGTTPLVNVMIDGLPSHADIELGIRGGRVKLRVKDTGSGKAIWAEVRLELVPPVDFHAGSTQTATGRDGSPIPLFVPAGEYRVSVLQYACGTVDFFARRPPTQVFVVAEGERLEKDINVDIQHIKAMNSYSNPQARTCRL